MADSFSQDNGEEVASGGSAQIGFTPSANGEAFRALWDVDLDALPTTGTLAIDSTDLTFSITNGAINLISVNGDQLAWQSSSETTFSIADLTGATGVDLDSADTQAFTAASYDFTANNLQLVNPGGGDTSDSETHAQGVFDFNAVLNDSTTSLPNVTVTGSNYVAVSPDITSPVSGTMFDVGSQSFQVKDLQGNGDIVVSYQRFGNQYDLWSFSGSTTISSLAQDSSNTPAFQNIPATLDLELQNNTYESLGLMVTESFSLFGATFDVSGAEQLTLQYNFSADEYEGTGEVTLEVDGNSIDMTLGDSTGPGIIIQQGIVTSVNADVAADFSFFGVDFETTQGGVIFQYDRTNEQYVMWGGMKLVDSITKDLVFELDMGSSATDAGLIIKNGDLQQIEAAVTSSDFKAGPLTWRVSDAGFEWTQDTKGNDVFVVYGSFFLKEIWQVAVTLGDGVSGDNSGLIYSSSGFELDGFEVDLKNVNVGFLTFKELMVSYEQNTTTGDYDINLDGNVFFPESKTSFDASLAFDTDKEAITAFSFSMNLGNDPFALGDTGLFVTAFGVDVQNPNSSSSFQITGSVAVVYGDQLTLAGKKVTIIAGVGTVTITKDEFVLDADTYWGANQTGKDSTGMPTYDGLLGNGNGTFTLDWGNNDYELDVEVKLFDDSFEVDGTFKFDGTDQNYFIYFEADAKVKVPHSIPFIGGKTLADFHFVFDYQNQDPDTGEPVGYAAAWTKLNFLVTKKDVGFLVDINDTDVSNPKSIGKHAIGEIKDGDYTPPTKLYTYSKSFQVPTGATVAEFQVQWPEAKGTQTVAYEFVPTGGSHESDNIIQQSDFGTSKAPNATLIANSTDAPASTLLTQLNDPQLESAGTYYYYLYSTEKFEDPDTDLNWQFTYSIPDPVVSLASDLPPSLDTDPTIGVNIQYQVGPGLDSGTTVTLYADTDNQGYDGFKVNSFTPSSDSGTKDNVTWNLTNLPLGEYYIYASINDGQNPTVYSAYSTQTDFEPTGLISGYVVDTVNGNIGVPGIQMYIDQNGDGKFDPSTEPSWTTNGDGYYRFDYEDAAHTTPLQSGSSYQVGLVTVEGVALSSGNNPRAITASSSDPFGAGTTFGLQINSSIQGTVFQDANQNGTYDSGEDGAQGWTVYVDLNNNGQLDVTDPSAVTTSDGIYRIFNLSPDTAYTLRLYQDFDTQSNYFPTSPTTLSVTTGSNQYGLVEDQNFGVLQYATISGTIDNYYLQSDGSLSTDTSPPPANWAIQLLNESGDPVGQTTADTTDGTYQFDGIKPGSYTVRQVVQSDWLQVDPVTADNPTFSHTLASTTTAPVAMVEADFDLDGDLDIATVAAADKAGTVTFLLNDGNGKFTKANITPSVSFESGEAFALEVINGFPKASAPSLAVVSKDGYVSVLKNITQPGQGLSFAPPINNYAHFLHASTMHGVTAGDFNEDGITDLAGSYEATSNNANRFSIVLMNSANNRIDGIHFDVPGQLGAADMNNDGHLDLVLNSGNKDGEFNVAYGDGTGSFNTNYTTWDLNGGDSSLDIKSDNGPVAIGDVNGDGLLDVVFGTGGDFGMVIQTQSSESGFFFLQAVSIDLSSDNVIGLGVDQIQGELFPNPVVLANTPSLDVWEMVDNGTELAGPITSLSNVETPAALSVADVNGDGLPDILAADSEKNGVWVYLNETTRDTDISVSAAAGQITGNLDFTNYQTAQVTGVAYDDTNFSGTRQSAESGLENVKVYVDSNQNGQFDDGEPFTLTNADGAYAFNNLADGTYTIAVAPDDGYLITAPTALSHQIVIQNGSVAGGDSTFDFGLTLGIQVSRYTNSIDTGKDWTLRRNGAYLELVDNKNGGILERCLLSQMHKVTLFASNFTADFLTIDFRYGGAFSLPGGIYVDGGRDGLAGGSILRFLGSAGDDVVQVSGTQATVNGDLAITWTDNLGSVIFDTGAGNDTFRVSGTPLESGPIDLIGGANDDTYDIATVNALLRIIDRAGVNTLDFSSASAGVSIDIALSNGQLQSIGAGNNELILNALITNLTGTPFADYLGGNSLDNTIDGLGGSDLLFGRGGNDILSTQSGNSALLGGNGDDTLIAGAGRNLLIGGNGSDTLINLQQFRPQNGNILIGGSTIYDDNVQALNAIMAEWGSQLPLNKRIADLTDGSGSKKRLNGDYFLNADTLVDDNDRDLLVGDSRMDWFLGFPGDFVVDLRPGRKKR